MIPNLPACFDDQDDNDLKLLATGSGFDGSKASYPYAASPFIVKDGDLQNNQEPDDRHTMYAYLKFTQILILSSKWYL